MANQTESEQATPVVSIKDVVRSSVKVTEFDKHLKKAGQHVGRNVVEITIKMKTIVRKTLMINNSIKVTMERIYYWFYCNFNLPLLNIPTENRDTWLTCQGWLHGTLQTRFLGSTTISTGSETYSTPQNCHRVSLKVSLSFSFGP